MPMKIAKYLLLFVVCILVGGILFGFFQDSIVLEPTAVMSLFVITFIFGLVLKLNYSHPFFVFNLVFGVVLVGLLGFGTGLITMLLLLLLQKLFKLL